MTLMSVALIFRFPKLSDLRRSNNHQDLRFFVVLLRLVSHKMLSTSIAVLMPLVALAAVVEVLCEVKTRCRT
jgi:hypothetical protein